MADRGLNGLESQIHPGAHVGPSGTIIVGLLQQHISNVLLTSVLKGPTGGRALGSDIMPYFRPAISKRARSRLSGPRCILFRGGPGSCVEKKDPRLGGARYRDLLVLLDRRNLGQSTARGYIVRILAST